MDTYLKLLTGPDCAVNLQGMYFPVSGQSGSAATPLKPLLMDTRTYAYNTDLKLLTISTCRSSTFLTIIE